MAVVEDGKAVAAVGIMGSYAEVAARKSEFIEILTRWRDDRQLVAGQPHFSL